MSGFYQQLFGRSVQPLLLFFLPAGFLVILFIVFGGASEQLVFDRSAIGQGELWRLVTSHFVHSDLNHLMMNGLACSMILPFIGTFKRLLGYVLFLCLLVSLGLWFFVPDIAFYCGASAILNGLLFLALWQHWQREAHWSYGLIFCGAVLKTVMEIANSQPVLKIYQWPALPESHLIGMMAAGVLIVFQFVMLRVTEHD